MLTKLTKQQEDLMLVIRKRWIDLSEREYKVPRNDLKLKELCTRFYKLCEINTEPYIIVAESPLELQRKANELNATKNQYYDMWESNINSDSYWVAHYDYFEEIGLLKNLENFHLYKEIITKLGYFTIWGNDVILTCDYPKIHKRKDGIVHNEKGPAYEFPNGEGYYVLNGVAVPEWVVMTHPDQLDPEKVLSIINADQKAEAIRKLGIERLASKGKVIDSYKNYTDEWYQKSKYELIDMSPIFQGLKYAPYLKMLNQTVPGVWHMEAIPKEIKTVQGAIELQLQTKNPKIQNIK